MQWYHWIGVLLLVVAALVFAVKFLKHNPDKGAAANSAIDKGVDAAKKAADSFKNKIGLILCVILVATSVEAMPTVQVGSSTLQWTTPTTYTDLSPLPLSDIGGFKVYWCRQNGGICTNTSTAAFNDAESKDVGVVNNVLIPSISQVFYDVLYCYAVTVYTKIGMESDFSNIVCKTNQTPFHIPTRNVLQ